MELMIALLIGLIISIGVVQIFSATRSTYQLDEALARAQENARFAMEFLTQDIRHAGYLGCSRDNNVIPVNFLVNPPTPKLPVKGVEAFEFVGTSIGDTYVTAAAPTNSYSGWTPALTAAMVPGTGAIPGTDVIKVQRMVPISSLVAPYITPTGVFMDPADVSKVAVNDVLLVADCRQAAVFMVTATDAGTGELSHAAGGTTNRCVSWEGTLGSPNAVAAECPGVFDNPVPGSVIGTIETIVFYVAVDPVSGRPTLFKNVMGPSGAGIGGQALVEGVENIQVLYGVDDVGISDGIPDKYVPANSVVDFSKVVSVQLGILVFGINATGAANDAEVDTETKVVAGTNITAPGDRRKRRVFSTTIQLRNRGA